MKLPITIAIILIIAILITASLIEPMPDYGEEIRSLEKRLNRVECYVYVEDKQRFIFKRAEKRGKE